MRVDDHRAKCESPLEILFWDEYQRINKVAHALHRLPSRIREQRGEEFYRAKSFLVNYGRVARQLAGLVAQHLVTVDSKTYRLDFALPDRKIAFEMDGYTYHGKERDHFNRDRRRDIDLKLAGWQVHRFDGDLIREDTQKVVRLAADLAGDQ